MGKTIEIRLSDAQHAALTEAHQANPDNRPFYGFCRDMLVAALTEPKPVLLRVPPQLSAGRSATVQVAAADAPAKVAEFAERLARLPQAAPTDDRIARIEDAVARLTDYVLGQAEPAQPPHQPPAAPVNVDDLVNAQFAQAEQQGLTEPEPDQADLEMQHAGVRPLSRRPMPFSAQNTPRHLQQLLG